MEIQNYINVDERYELISLVFRLRGWSGQSYDGYTDTETDYQRELNETFSGYKGHPAVKFSRSLQFGYDAVFSFAVHMEKTENKFIMADNIDFLVADGRWTRENAAEFIGLLNDFYIDVKFADFYTAHIPYYTEHINRFLEKNKINRDWFKKYGLNPKQIMAVISPSSSKCGYAAKAASKDGEIFCGAIPGSLSYDSGLQFLVHEFSHNFANSIAEKWYAEEKKEDFKQWCDNFQHGVHPYGNSAVTVAREYLTRAYTILYLIENTGANLLHLLLAEKADRFSHIEDVYAMITSHKKIDLGDDVIGAILGCKYSIGEEQSFEKDGKIMRWRTVDLFGEKISVGYISLCLPAVHYIFGTQTGEAVCVDYERGKFLYIDCGKFGQNEKDRKYLAVKLD
jgi:hypothetical protein